jgi:hypothetical protein
LDLFEETILANATATEHDASRFFEKFPQFLLLGGASEIRREVLLFAPSGHAIGRVDFFRRSYGRRFWDIIELKTPQTPVVVNAQGIHPKLSNKIEVAIAQAEDYKEFIETNSPTRQALFAKGIHVCKPELLVFAGQENEDVQPEIIERLFDRVRRKGIQLHSYTDLFRFAKEHYRSNRIIIIPAAFTDTSTPEIQALLHETRQTIRIDPEIQASIEQAHQAIRKRRSMKVPLPGLAAKEIENAEIHVMLRTRELFVRFVDRALWTGLADPEFTKAVRKVLVEAQQSVTHDSRVKESVQRRLRDFEGFCRQQQSLLPLKDFSA